MFGIFNRLILLFGIGITNPQPIQSEMVALCLASIILSLTLEFKMRKLTCLSYILYFLLALYVPRILIFYPLMVYNITSDLLKKHYESSVFLALFFKTQLSTVWICLFASYLAYLIIDLQRAYEKIKESSLEKLHIAEQLKQAKKKYDLEILQNEKITQLTERERISRQLHDSIGHTITGSILALEAQNILHPDKQLLVIRDNLQKGLDDIRTILYDEKYRAFVIEEKLHQLFSDAPLHYQLTIQETELSYDMKIVLYSAMKESVTNTLKHSDATEMELKLFCHPRNIILFIKDNGSQKVDIDHLQYSTGLNSLRELAIKYDGIVEFSYRQGFIIFMNIKREKYENHFS